jgi:hypothetical protein
MPGTRMSAAPNCRASLGWRNTLRSSALRDPHTRQCPESVSWMQNRRVEKRSVFHIQSDRGIAPPGRYNLAGVLFRGSVNGVVPIAVPAIGAAGA